jgi:translocation and assembly module TamA
MPLPGRSYWLALALIPAPAFATWQISAPAHVVELVQSHLPEQASPRRVHALIEEMLATEGYFSPVIALSEPHIQITPGERTHIVAVDIAVDGNIDPKKLNELRQAWLLPIGKAFRQSDWNQAKQNLLAEMLAINHPDARIVDSRAEIDPQTREARLFVHYDAGPSYRFGQLNITGLHRYSPGLVGRYTEEVQPGKPYRAESLMRLAIKLSATPYFATARAELDRENVDFATDGTATAAVNLRVRERPGHRAGFGAGISSNTGLRVEANYHTPNLFNQAWEWDTGLRLEQKRQTLYSDVLLPPDKSQRRHGLGFVTESSNIENLKINRYAIGVQSIQQRGSVEQRLSLNWQREQRQVEAGERVISRALVPNAQWTWRQLDNPLEPRRGTVFQFGIGGATKIIGSDQNFLRLHGRAQFFLPVGPRDTLSLRAELGRTISENGQRVPQDYLFRTGGTGSVRGYDYQSLGIKEGSATLGARYLAVGSAEYTHWLNESWALAAFVDAGDAVDALSQTKLALGYGLGFRWRSPAGPIGADIAYGERERRLHLHFSLSIPF